ncbi:MAG: amidohydrolase family protein [Desulfovibrio fairfieldensis]
MCTCPCSRTGLSGCWKRACWPEQVRPCCASTASSCSWTAPSRPTPLPCPRAITAAPKRPAPIIPQEELENAVFKAHSAGQQAVIHGNGNGAVEAAVRAVEKAQARCPRRDPRHLLIHCQMASDEQLARMKAVGLWPSFFGLHVWNWGDRHHDIFLGPKRAARIDPCGGAARLGLRFSLHADTPVLPQMTMQSIHTAVNRRTRAGRLLGPDQRVRVLDPLRAYTTHAAAMCFEEDRRGSIEPGKLADFTLLDADPRAVAPEDINKVNIVSVISMGRPVWGTLKD